MRLPAGADTPGGAGPGRHAVGNTRAIAPMKKILAAVVALILLLLVGGAVLLGTLNIPPPSGAVERVIPNDRFQR